MSVIFDQLRIGDNGQCMFIDAHVNKASYFDDVYLKRITICTEEQVQESDPLSYGEDYIFQQDIEPSSQIQSVYDKVQILSEKQLLANLNAAKGIILRYSPVQDSETHYLSLVFSGKYSVLDTGYPPKLVVATKSFNSDEDSLNSQEILFTINGVAFEDKGHRVWQFKGKGEIGNSTPVYLYLYKQTEEGYELVKIDETDDYEFLHFLWQVYSEGSASSQKELHLVLDCNSFNEKFTKQDLSHNMFFVYIECDGVPAVDTPCRLDEMTTLGVTFDYGAIYNLAMGYTRELANTCDMPQNFIDFILNVEALKMSIETEHFIPAIGYWQWLMGNSNGKTIGYGLRPCGCHG